MRLKKLRQKINQLKLELQATVIDEVLSCKHSKIYECAYVPPSFLGYDAIPPMRVCNNCGLSEEGWGYGYIVLNGEVIIINRDILYKKRTVKTIKDKDKRPFIKNIEKALEDYLIENRSSIG